MSTTPGPWEWKGGYLNGPSGFVLRASVRANLADRDLIAAAPDLLAACKAAFDWFEETTAPCDPDCNCTHDMLRAAIAKATGGEA